MNVRSYWFDWWIKTAIFVAVFLFILSFIIIAYTFFVLDIGALRPSFVVLHSSIYFGVDRIADLWQLFILPIFGFLVFCLNFFIADRLWKISHSYTRLVLFSTVFIEFFVLLACISILRWNI